MVSLKNARQKFDVKVYSTSSVLTTTAVGGIRDQTNQDVLLPEASSRDGVLGASLGLPYTYALFPVTYTLPTSIYGILKSRTTTTTILNKV